VTESRFKEARPVAEHQRVEAKLPQGGGAWTSDGRCGEEARDDLEAPCGGRQVQCPCAPVGVAAVGVDVDLARVGELDDASPMAPHAGVVGVVDKPEGVHLGRDPVLRAAAERDAGGEDGALVQEAGGDVLLVEEVAQLR
jgi:hypothetical protein